MLALERSLLSTENLTSIHQHSDETDRESGNGEEMELTRGGHAAHAASAPALLGAEFTRQGPRGWEAVFLSARGRRRACYVDAEEVCLGIFPED